MAQPCIFCDKNSGSREHLWPAWILKRRDFGPFRLKLAGKSEVTLNKTELTVKSVCGDCNNGWMSKLEAEVKPILEQMFEDRPVSLDQMQQQLVAVWIAKMAFLFDTTKGRNATNVFYEKAETEVFAQNRQIPQFTGIWIGRMDEMHRSADGADFTLKSPDERIGGGSAFTLMSEHFIGQITSLRLKENPTGPTVLNIESKPGEWPNMLIQIWPIREAVVHWPPNVSFTASGPRSYYFLMDRWRIGDEVQKVTKDGVVELDQSST